MQCNWRLRVYHMYNTPGAAFLLTVTTPIQVSLQLVLSKCISVLCHCHRENDTVTALSCLITCHGACMQLFV